MELDRALLLAVELEEGVRAIGGIERQVAVGDVRDHEQVVLAREPQELSIEVLGLAGCGRIVREVHRNGLGATGFLDRNRSQIG